MGEGGTAGVQVVLVTRGLADREAKLGKATADLVSECIASRQVRTTSRRRS